MKKELVNQIDNLDCLNILGVYYSAPLATKLAGSNWYKQAYNIAENIAAKTNITIETVTAVISAISPNNKWTKNVFDADRLCTASKNGFDLGDVKVSTYNPNKEKARLILQNTLDKEHRTRDILNGQKVTAFYDCILYAGNKSHLFGKEAVCVDGHAKSIYYGERFMLSSNKSNISKKEYSTISAAYSSAAKIINSIEGGENMTGCNVQAITWNHWRNLHNIK